MKISGRIAVIVPCYKPGGRVVDVVRSIGSEVDFIICVDDACPQGSADLLEQNIKDTRLHIIRHSKNCGVGGATMTGWKKGLELGADILVKVDADGQMDATKISALVRPLLDGSGDYAKGNRFYDPAGTRAMPPLRLFGNAVLSFLTKLSSGYWDVFDPTNGFTAIEARVVAHLPLDRIDARYFFESDVLFRLYLARAVVIDVPMEAHYQGEPSQLDPLRVAPGFFGKNVKNIFKRTLYTYFLRDFRPASLNLIFGLPLMIFGLVYGAHSWIANAFSGHLTSAGQVMIAALPIILGMQMVLAALNEDIANVPKRPIHPFL
ncbi:MAG: glycosyl transferase family 2 [Robiginitomaculum sp.]|nr:MAG: glycosyl transferase family 2 [Robiginitomaculum sp.]